MEHDDRQLIDACLRGDERAWDAFVERYGRLVFSIALRAGLPASDADDVLQTVFAIALRRLETLRDAERVSAWLIRLTYRESWRMRKRQRRASVLDENVADESEPTVDELERVERQHLVRRALESLDSRCQELLTALFLESEAPSYEALAERLGMRVGSIGPTRARCFEKMQRELSDLGL